MAFRVKCKSLCPLLFALTCAGTGCNDLPSEQYVEYPRILGLKARVISSPLREIDPQDTRPFAEALPFETVVLDEWVVSPQGPAGPGSLDGRWIACERLPSTGTSDCLRGYIRDKDEVLQKMDLCPKFDGLPGLGHQQPDLPDLPTRTPPCLIPPNERPSTFAIPLSINMLLGASMEFWYIASVPGKGPKTSDCIKEFLEGASDLNDNCLYGVTSVDIGPLEQLEEIFGELGSGPSPEGEGAGTPEQPSTDAEGKKLPPAEGNRHPRLSSIFYTIEQDEVPVTPAKPYEPGDIIEAPLGSSVRLDVSLPIAELQTYPVPVNDGEEIVLRTEEYQSSWYYTWGSLGVANDRPEVAIERWILEPDKEQEQPNKSEGDEVFAYFAVRDSRGGIDWMSFIVQLTEPTAQSQN